ncbi:MAG: MBL fold metallo-hydrolase [Sphingobacteriales bacterium]|nr:MBL fold metallo-hydrolase [Sphingobacteriales bacterium]
MNRRSFLQQSAFSFGALTFLQKDILTALFQEPWKISMLTDEIGIFTEKGGTIAFYLSKKGIAVVDAQFPDQSKHLIDELKKKSEKPFKLLINTHHHGDHTAGNISFKGLVEHVLAHANSRINQEHSAKQSKNEDQQLYPDQTYTDTWCEKLGKENICLYYYGAAHTNGDSFVHFQHANIVHCGDLVFNRRHPYVDRAAGANIKSWMEVLDKALNQFDSKTRFVFGHSGPGYEITGKTSDLTAFRDYLGNVLKFVEGEIKAGKTKEEILKATIIPGGEEWKSDGIQRPLTAAWEELKVLS